MGWEGLQLLDDNRVLIFFSLRFDEFISSLSSKDAPCWYTFRTFDVNELY
jgi:hypothetical protein